MLGGTLSWELCGGRRSDGGGRCMPSGPVRTVAEKQHMAASTTEDEGNIARGQAVLTVTDDE